ncbi:reverse transcriptase [Gossypium australe]|uniref:Reverse transcriptase n=1 Tax=Gossypium australe TaxID=47621 RepID=A0A5B6VF38_9ROSI|nr:reverse transcriptase [Gossypium australe]
MKVYRLNHYQICPALVDLLDYPRVLFLPSEVIKEVTQLCHPKTKGGLRNLWSVWFKVGSLWVAWVDLYILKGRDVLQMQARESRWAWKKFLRLQNLNPLIGGFQESYKAKKSWELLRHKHAKFHGFKLSDIILLFLGIHLLSG